MTIRALNSDDARARIDELVEVLMDCVQGGASVGFMQPLTAVRAETFWRRVIDGVAVGERHLLVAENAEGRIDGTASLITDMPDNQPHRADVAKVLVHRRARRRGLATALMDAVHALAQSQGRTLLVLDTVTGSDASRVYERLGYRRCGDIPGYALFPDGRVCSTTYYYKSL